MLLLIPTRLLLGALLTAAGSAALIVPVASPAPTASSPLAALALFAVLAARLGIAAASRPGAGSPWSFLALPVLVLLLVRFRAMEFGPPLAVAFLLWAPAPAIATALSLRLLLSAVGPRPRTAVMLRLALGLPALAFPLVAPAPRAWAPRRR